MASYEKNKAKNFGFKEGNNPSFPLPNKKINLINYYSALKLDNKKDFKRLKKNTNTKTYTDLEYKNIIENSSRLNNSKIKIKPLDFSSNTNSSKILENIIKENMNNKKPLLISNKTNINSGINTTRDNRSNINIISPKSIFDKSQVININNVNKKNIINQINPNISKNLIEISESSNNKSYINNIIINNSSTNINSDHVNNNSKIHINNIEINSPKESNVKLIFKNNNSTKKLKVDNLDTPIVLKRNESPFPFSATNQNILKNMNNFNGHYKLSFKNKRNISDLNDILNADYIKNFINNELKFKYELKKKKKISGPEDLHFYYILMIQDGKKNEIEFEKDKN